MSRTDRDEPAFPDDHVDDDFDAWSLDDLDDFVDEHALRGQAAHDTED